MNTSLKQDELANRRRAACGGSARGFSLIELMAVMAILVMLVGVLSNLLSSSEESAGRGLDHTRSQAAAQAALVMLSRDLETAVADEHLAFLLSAGTPSYGMTNSRLSFVGMQTPESDSVRDAHITTYEVQASVQTWGTNYNLVRRFVPIPSSAGTGDVLNAYWSDGWTSLPGAEEATLVRNVAAFKVWAETDDGWLKHYDSRTTVDDNRPPHLLDIYLEVLDEGDARRDADMERFGATSSNIIEFVELNVRRYTARACPAQREGYRNR